jgi:hypothetical protein
MAIARFSKLFVELKENVAEPIAIPQNKAFFGIDTKEYVAKGIDEVELYQ